MNQLTRFTRTCTIILVLLGLAVALGGVTAAWGAPPKPATIIAPVQLSFEGSCCENGGDEAVLASYDVPADSYLIIEMATVLADTHRNEGLAIFIETTVNGVTAKHYLTTAETYEEPQVTIERLFRVGTNLVKAVADPGTTAMVKAKHITFCSDGDCPIDIGYSGSVSGYLVNSWILP